MIFLLQLENASDKLLEYGVLGLAVIALCFTAYKMYNKINDDQAEWKNIAKEQMDHNYKTNIEQNRINQRLIDIRERDVDQNREHHKMIENRINSLPKEIREELKTELLEQNYNRTPGCGNN